MVYQRKPKTDPGRSKCWSRTVRSNPAVRSRCPDQRVVQGSLGQKSCRGLGRRVSQLPDRVDSGLHEFLRGRRGDRTDYLS